MDNEIFKWCGYDWDCKMEGGRIIHPSDPYNWLSNSDDVVKRMRNGELHFYFRENKKEIKYWDGKTYNPNYERGLIRSLQHFDYGTFSLDMMMPAGLNMSCAFWLSGDGNWPPEIDICEAWADDTNYSRKIGRRFPWFYKSWDTTSNIHYNNKKLKHKQIHPHEVPKCKQPYDPTITWVTYECEWTPDKITFKANGKVTNVVRKSVSNALVNNLKKPENGHLMDVIIDVNMPDPDVYKVVLESPLKVKNFKYKPME